MSRVETFSVCVVVGALACVASGLMYMHQFDECTYTVTDLNGDGTVTLVDFSIAVNQLENVMQALQDNKPETTTHESYQLPAHAGSTVSASVE